MWQKPEFKAGPGKRAGAGAWALVDAEAMGWGSSGAGARGRRLGGQARSKNQGLAKVQRLRAGADGCRMCLVARGPISVT